MGQIKSRVVAMALVIGSIGSAAPAALAAPAKQAAPIKQAARVKQAAPQPKPKETRLARLYFLREKGIFGAMGGLTPSAEIKIDDQAAGKVEMGSFFAVDRPPGVHKIAAHVPLSLTDYEVEIPIEAGQTYYFGIATQRGGPPVQDLLNQAIAGSSGEQIRSSSPFKSAFAGPALFRLDPSAGAAAILKLKQP